MLSPANNSPTQYLIEIARRHLYIYQRRYKGSKLYPKGKVQGRIFASMKDEDCLQSLDKQVKGHDLPERLPVCVRTQTRRAQAGL